MIRAPTEPELTSPDADFRRAFPINSRSTWIEQQNVHGILFPRENLPVGPGEYSPVKPSSHLSTPLLGSRGDHFRTFEGSVASRSGTASRQGTAKSTAHPPRKALPVSEDVEFKTLFYDHNSREPLDPKNRHTATPGPRLGHGSLSDGFITYDGKRSVRCYSFGPNDIPFGERMPSKLALPDYDVKDTVGAKRVPLGFVTDEERFIFTSQRKRHEDKPHDPEELLDRPWRRCPTAETFSRHQRMLQEIDNASLANAHQVKVSKLQPKVRLDKSAYRSNFNAPRADGCRYKKLESVDPKSINQQIRSNPFKGMLTLRRQHVAMGITSKVGDTLRKYTDDPN